MLKHISGIITLFLMFPPSALCAVVYQKDGGTIECKSFWKNKTGVHIKINEGLVVDLQLEEVDIRKTFNRPITKKTKKTIIRKIKANTKNAVANLSESQKIETAKGSTEPVGGKYPPYNSYKSQEGNTYPRTDTTGKADSFPIKGSKITLKKQIPVCETFSDLSKFRQIIKSGDTQASSMMLYGEKCAWIRAGRTIYVEDTGADDQPVIVRPEGLPTSVYTFFWALVTPYQTSN